MLIMQRLSAKADLGEREGMKGTVLVHTLEQGDKSRDFRVSQPHSVTLVV